MGLYLDESIHNIEPDSICTVRKMPISDGSLSLIMKKRDSFDVWKLAQRPSMRRSYRSGRLILVYNVSLLVDGTYEAVSCTREGKRITHRVQIISGKIQPSLEGMEEWESAADD